MAREQILYGKMEVDPKVKQEKLVELLLGYLVEDLWIFLLFRVSKNGRSGSPTQPNVLLRVYTKEYYYRS